MQAGGDSAGTLQYSRLLKPGIKRSHEQRRDRGRSQQAHYERRNNGAGGWLAAVRSQEISTYMLMSNKRNSHI